MLTSHLPLQVLRLEALDMMGVRLLCPVSYAAGKDRQMLYLQSQPRTLLPASTSLPHQKQEQAGNVIKQLQIQPVQKGK